MWFESNTDECAMFNLWIYVFELGLNTVKAIKNICCTKGKCAVNHGKVTRWCKNFDNQATSGRPKTNLASSTKRVSGEFGIL